jgi:hypothetical protein
MSDELRDAVRVDRHHRSPREGRGSRRPVYVVEPPAVLAPGRASGTARHRATSRVEMARTGRTVIVTIAERRIRWIRLHFAGAALR